MPTWQRGGSAQPQINDNPAVPIAVPQDVIPAGDQVGPMRPGEPFNPRFEACGFIPRR